MPYYDSCAIPKPADKKKPKLANGYKSKENRTCHYCGTAGAERHEIYGGANRKISIQHQFQVDLCQGCHLEIEANITDRAKERNEYWQKHFQSTYESKLIGALVPKKQARELWMLLIGWNYLEPED